MSSAPLRRRAAPDASGRDEAFWAAILARDPSFDGRFFYSVASTGIYCRPTCAARRPKRGHVSFHATAEAAERAGFRPCKRCKPKETSPAQERAARVSAACRLIEAADQPPSLGTLAAAVDLSPHHFHRVFKATLGITPKAYAAAHRRKRLRGELGQSATITAAIYGAGFNSSSRFYATSSEALGMTPTQFRQGAPDATIAFAIGQCSLGAILVAASAEGVCAVLFGDNAETLRRDLARQFPRAHLAEGDKDYRQLMAKVIALVEDPREDPDLPLDIRGTAFQHRVWDA
ncbi:MAG: bifunctional transcriptional activator/DNA repair enzyme AdaA, partial [Methyloceanibacter sp.]